MSARPRIIVCGSREWSEPNFARKIIANRLFDVPVESIIVHGAARGADRFAHQEAEKLGLLVEPHPADWSKSRKRAGLIRNEEMAALGADLCIAFWNGKSSGTRHMVETAKKHGIPVEEFLIQDGPAWDYLDDPDAGEDDCNCFHEFAPKPREGK